MTDRLRLCYTARMYYTEEQIRYAVAAEITTCNRRDISSLNADMVAIGVLGILSGKGIDIPLDGQTED